MIRSPLASLTTVPALALMLLAGTSCAEEAANSKAAPAAEAADTATGTTAAEASDAPLDMDKISYAIGLNIAQSLNDQLESQGVALSTEQVLAGLRDGRSDGQTKMTDEQVAAALQSLQMEMMKRQMAQAQAEADANLAAGTAFLDQNAGKDGVVTTESGLQYKIIDPGEGVSPKIGDDVTVHYHGTLIDGTVFDSSKQPPQPGRPSQPASFTLGQVIPGWNEGLSHIGKGGKIMLYIPANLAYGPQGRPPVIAPNATLVFEVELLDVKPADAQTEPAETTPDAGQ